ncbi:MAG TPA: cupin domain-containing protein [Burkholderiales bacterium]|nr:cupin domain-containing protein [Burkholderiales bacterium]
MKSTKLLVVAGLAAALGAGALYAQAPGFKRIEVQDRDLSIAGRHAVQAKAEFDPGGAVGRHTHPGEELSIVLEGQLLLEVDGQPARTVKAGESFFIPAGTIHAGKNTGSGKAVVFATYIVEKGKPVATAAK